MTSSAHSRTSCVLFLRYFFFPFCSSFLAFLRSPVTIGTIVACMCGVFSSMCRTADTRFRSPYVSRSHCRLSLHHSSSCPSASICFMSLLLPVSSTRIAFTWLVPTLRLIPAVSIRCAIACVRFLTPSGNCTNSRFRCVRVLSAFLGWTVRSMCADILLSVPFAFSKCKTTYPITVIHFSVNTSPALFPCRMAPGFQKGRRPFCSLGLF